MRERGIRELYVDDVERADALVWGRRSEGRSRRGFLQDAGLAALGAALGANLPFARFLPGGFVPAAFAADDAPIAIPGKDGLRVLLERPLNAETPAHLLDDPITPTARLFVRNASYVPERAERMDAAGWTLTVDGEVERPLTLSLAELKRNFEPQQRVLTLECAGNGRAGFEPRIRRMPWTTGAVGCPRWTGVRLRDLLEAAGVRRDAVYVAYESFDVNFRKPEQDVISRGVPLRKALEDTTLVAWALNDEPLPALHGFPARLVCPGYPGSASGKWLRRIWVRDRVHDGRRMGPQAYRMPDEPKEPGARMGDTSTTIIEEMPVKSLVTFPRNTASVPHDRPLTCRGFAWTGHGKVVAVDVSLDYGQTWTRARLAPPVNALAWQRWETELRLPSRGYFEIAARAQDATGRTQPFEVPGWNPGGYLNNAVHRVAVYAV